MKKNPYKAWRRASKWTTKLNFDQTNIARLVLWAKRCILIINRATLSFTCVITSNLALWNTLLPSNYMDISFSPKSLTFKLPKVTMIINIKWCQLKTILHRPKNKLTFAPEQVLLVLSFNLEPQWPSVHGELAGMLAKPIASPQSSQRMNWICTESVSPRSTSQVEPTPTLVPWPFYLLN